MHIYIQHDERIEGVTLKRSKGEYRHLSRLQEKVPQDKTQAR